MRIEASSCRQRRSVRESVLGFGARAAWVESPWGVPLARGGVLIARSAVGRAQGLATHWAFRLLVLAACARRGGELRTLTSVWGLRWRGSHGLKFSTVRGGHG